MEDGRWISIFIFSVYISENIILDPLMLDVLGRETINDFNYFKNLSTFNLQRLFIFHFSFPFRLLFFIKVIIIIITTTNYYYIPYM